MEICRVRVILNANTIYYIMSQETQGGDQWYDVNTSIQTTNVASETTGIWSPDGVTYNQWGSADQSYGPLDFQYAMGSVVTQPVITQQRKTRRPWLVEQRLSPLQASGGNLTYQWWSRYREIPTSQ